MHHPHHYPKRILLAVSGMSPQIVTETLYSLAISQSTPFIPTEIHLITTQTGAKEARLQLLHPKTGKFLQLCQDYQLPDIHFPESNIHIIVDNQQHELDDIKTPAQNEAAADFITKIVNQLTRDENTALHVSIAGGRKTMGYYLGYALSLYGRAQDRLSHVLVTDRFESLKDFFYPTADSQVIEDRNGRSLDAKDAEVMLAEIPFVRLRSGIPKHLQEGNASFGESIKFVRQIENAPQLRIDTANRCFWVADTKITLNDVDFCFYLWLLERTLKSEFVQRPIRDNNMEYAQEFLAILAQQLAEKRDTERTKNALESGMSKQWLSERNSAIAKSFNEALGVHFAKPFIVSASGGNNSKQYFIDLSEDQVIYSQ